MRFVSQTLSNKAHYVNSKTKNNNWAAMSGVRAHSKGTAVAYFLLREVSVGCIHTNYVRHCSVTGIPEMEASTHSHIDPVTVFYEAQSKSFPLLSSLRFLKIFFIIIINYKHYTKLYINIKCQCLPNISHQSKNQTKQSKSI